MNRKVNLADNLLLVGVVVVVGIIALWLVSAVISTILFAVKVLIVVVAIAIGWRVVNAVTGGDKRRELKR